MHHWTVTLPSWPLEEAESVSSTDQLAEQWSTIISRPDETDKESLSAFALPPGRHRICRTMTWSAAITRAWFFKQMPSPGAVWPAMVTYGLEMTIDDFKATVPDTRKITVLCPSVSAASRKLPGPQSSRFVTKRTLPLRPPIDWAPNPSAPGKAGTDTAVSGTNRVAHTTRNITKERYIIYYFSQF